MKSKNKCRRLWNRLSFRLCVYFFLLLAVFSSLLVFTFDSFYGKSSMNAYRESQQELAMRIAKHMAILVRENDKRGFIAYQDAIKSIENQETTDVWYVSNENSETPMDSAFSNVDMDDISLTPEMSSVLNSAFAGETGFSIGYDKIYESSVVRVGSPIYGETREVIGAVLIVSLVENHKSVVDSSKLSLGISAALALLVSLMIALFMTTWISKPVRDMRIVANELAKGNYRVKTGSKREDDIGILSQTLDILSNRLLVAEQERENEEQMRRDFFANVSHELRTPITVMRGYTEALVDGVVEEEEKKQQYYERMLGECKMMERLVMDLLLLSKMQNPDFQVEKEPVNLVQVFYDIYRSANIMAEEKKIEIHMMSEDDCCMMMGDYDRLRQMFLVILDNAIKFSNEGGNVYISIQSTGPRLKVSIRDEGIGIPENEMPYIFEKFYKSKLRQNAKGTGLGLMIAKYIALKHDGEIEVESQVGIGTIFNFFFDKTEVDVL